MTPRARSLFAGAAAAIGLSVAFALSAAGQDNPLSDADRQDIARIEAYLGGIDTLQARFLQTSSDGRMAEGTVYLDRPGRMRMTYAEPLELEVIATGTLLVYHDKEMRQVRQVPLAATPAGMLLAEDPRLSGDVAVTEVERFGAAIRVTVVQKGQQDAGSMTLGFSDKPLMLRRVVLRDAEGAELQVGLMDHQVGLPLDPALFEFTDPYGAGRRD